MERIEHPLFFSGSPQEIKARDLSICACTKAHAVALTKQWHSRLPRVQASPWMFAFKAHFNEVTYAVALWHNTSAKDLPDDWLELRRMAIAPDAPYNTASRMLGAMTRLIGESGAWSRCVSYQDIGVHLGTIYKASNWVPTHFSRPRFRDRLPLRAGTSRQYRKDSNSLTVAASGKIRWEYGLTRAARKEVHAARIEIDLEEMLKVKPTK